MKTQILTIVLALFVATAADATNKKHYPKQDQDQTQHQSIIDNDSLAMSMGSQQNEQTLNTTILDNDSLAMSMGPQQNEQSITFEEASKRDIRIKNTPSPDAPSISPSHPCALVWTAAASGAGFGVSGGKAYVDEKCNIREWARLMFQMGARDAALYVMCQQPEGADGPDCQGVTDYNKELAMWKLGHDQLVDENDTLRQQLETLRNEQAEAKAKCDTSVKRIGDRLNDCLSK